MFQRLLVPLDEGELAPRSIEAGVALARRLGAAITGFIAEPPVPLPSAGVQAGAHPAVASVEELRTNEHAQRLLHRFELAAGRAGVAFNADYDHSPDIAGAIVEAAQRNHCDLILMVTHRRGALSRLVHGSHTRQVLARSPVAVLVMN
jgi:nucleotide-binding universal stress UspA family protein